MKTKEWIEHLQSSDLEESICIHLWRVNDILETAEEMGEEINNEEAQYILDDIEENIDCELGVTWATIRKGIEDFVDFRKTDN
ncbi:MAG: hypothetical protein P4L27_09995 [Ignavibacteriaceae bacterium]|nr:hypothetical protein [Ignavibacteriaceae bacterium]